MSDLRGVPGEEVDVIRDRFHAISISNMSSGLSEAAAAAHRLGCCVPGMPSPASSTSSNGGIGSSGPTSKLEDPTTEWLVLSMQSLEAEKVRSVSHPILGHGFSGSPCPAPFHLTMTPYFCFLMIRSLSIVPCVCWYSIFVRNGRATPIQHTMTPKWLHMSM